MKFMLIYTNREIEFPKTEMLLNEFKCAKIADLVGTQYSVEENSKWSGVDPKLLYDFAFGFVKMKSDLVNKIWNIDPNRSYYEGKCHLYLLSDDINRKLIDWWSIKNEFTIKLFEINEIDLNEVLRLSYSASAIDAAHQYSSAKHSREDIFKYHKSHLTEKEISYLERLSVQEDAIKIKFETIKDRLHKKIIKIFKKGKL
jgi:hypothetical protein